MTLLDLIHTKLQETLKRKGKVSLALERVKPSCPLRRIVNI